LRAPSHVCRGSAHLEAGSEARFYHVVETGALRRSIRSGPGRPVAFVGAGEMFSLD
jgi:hypothetical protein